MQQKPSALLRKTERARDFIGANAILCIGDYPHRGNPFIEADGGIFHDRADLGAELLFAIFAFPNAVG